MRKLYWAFPNDLKLPGPILLCPRRRQAYTDTIPMVRVRVEVVKPKKRRSK